MTIQRNSRRLRKLAAAAGGGWLVAAGAFAGLPEVSLETAATGLAVPVSITHAGDPRLFITLQAGRILIHEDGRVLPRPFLDIRSRVLAGGERGLLGLAFHPDYAANGYFFVDYTDLEGDTVIARFAVSTDPDVADPTSEAILLEIEQPFSNHNGGQLQFGPDGYLYVGTGDGGSAADPGCRAQDGSTLLGKVLRLDVDASAGSPPYHGIPAGNPFVGVAGIRDEIWALGLRNPWRFSFDRMTGDLFIADVGENSREEVNLQPAASPGGENYGWKVMEGSLCLGSDCGCSVPVPACDSPDYTPPIVEFAHDNGRCAVIGGYVYRGAAIPELAGRYLYGDLCAGSLWLAEETGGRWQTRQLPSSVPGLTTFGEDAAGEIWLADRSTLYRLVAGAPEPPPCVPGPAALCLNRGRFRVEASWSAADGDAGAGRAVSISPESGYFWFFAADNPELFVKVLDACAEPFRHYWVFAAGLTDVETRLTVVDTATGEERRYDKPLGQGFDPIRDTTAFDTCP